MKNFHKKLLALFLVLAVTFSIQSNNAYAATDDDV